MYRKPRCLLYFPPFREVYTEALVSSIPPRRSAASLLFRLTPCTRWTWLYTWRVTGGVRGGQPSVEGERGVGAGGRMLPEDGPDRGGQRASGGRACSSRHQQNQQRQQYHQQRHGQQRHAQRHPQRRRQRKRKRVLRLPRLKTFSPTIVLPLISWLHFSCCINAFHTYDYMHCTPWYADGEFCPPCCGFLRKASLSLMFSF